MASRKEMKDMRDLVVQAKNTFKHQQDQVRLNFEPIEQATTFFEEQKYGSLCDFALHRLEEVKKAFKSHAINYTPVVNAAIDVYNKALVFKCLLLDSRLQPIEFDFVRHFELHLKEFFGLLETSKRYLPNHDAISTMGEIRHKQWLEKEEVFMATFMSSA